MQLNGQEIDWSKCTKEFEKAITTVPVKSVQIKIKVNVSIY